MPEIRSYADAAKYLGNKAERPLPGRTTRLIRRGEGTIVVRYSQTDVVTYRADGSLAATSGGWKTVTTKERLNRYTALNVSQDKGIWYVAGRELIFQDGITLLPSGKILGAGTNPKKELALRKQVKAYAKEYAQRLQARKIPAPSGGDCWGCLMFDQVTPGSKVTNPEHLRGHLSEPYYVPTLVVNALKWAGYEQGKSLIYNDLAYAFGQTSKPLCCLWPTMEKVIKRFLYTQLGLANSR